MSTSPATSSSNYEHRSIEEKWQKHWDENQTFVAKRRPNHPKKYVLDMFPYPSGSGLHVGHPEGYTATDIMARYWRMKDFDVLHPMGWDSFGLPAEQHAINTGTHPAETTYLNIARQLKSLGFSYDWSREIATTDDHYVKWTQWIFLQLYKKGLASQSEVSVNWCPKLGTVLANEEIIDGLSERGNHPVQRLPLRQWVLKITNYADQLEQGLGLGLGLDRDALKEEVPRLDWPEGTLSAQKQWIGRSTGAEISFSIPSIAGKSIDVFTTRPDTLMGVTYLVLAPEHPLVATLSSPEQKPVVDAYLAQITGKSDLERTALGKDRGKTGVALGVHAVHPITQEPIPVWIADYVLSGYGTGAVMAVPAHDERDYEFANIFNLPIKQVILPPDSDAPATAGTGMPYSGVGTVMNSGAALDGLDSTAAKEKVTDLLESAGSGRRQTTFKLRDWVFSRQRYWGEPIPIYFPVKMLTQDATGNPAAGDPHEVMYDQPIAVAEEDLPLRLPEMRDFHPGDDPRGCLARAVDWRFFQKNGEWFARETNTMPQWAGSCWYYLRFTDPHNHKSLLSEEGASWLPVDLYVGGQEHAVLHLLYARFWHKVLHEIGVVDHPEPFLKLVHQGMILGSDNEKMSKSRGNVVNPDEIVAEHGADALRLYEMFMGPLEATKPWQSSQLIGVVRFRDKIFSLIQNNLDALSATSPDASQERTMHRVIKKVTSDIEAMAFNTAISSLMIYTNTLIAATKDASKSGSRSGSGHSGKGSTGPGDALSRQEVETLVLLVSPFAPHLAEECWQLLGHKTSLAHHPWPTFQPDLCLEDEVNITVSVNGKVRGSLTVPAPGPEGYADVDVDGMQVKTLKAALQLEKVKGFVGDKQVKKVIFKPGKIINIIV